MSGNAAPTAAERAEIRRILAMAARGLSDREIARALGCSLRTVTRRFSGAMAAYGARSRFHLGFLLAAADAEPGRAAEAGGGEQPGRPGGTPAGPTPPAWPDGPALPDRGALPDRRVPPGRPALPDRRVLAGRPAS